MKTLCIYHANCADGFGAAWVVRQALGAENVEFHAGHYGKPAPDVEGRDVIIVDFSYPYELLVLLGHQARSILIIDHHKTAAEALAQLPTPATTARQPSASACSSSPGATASPSSGPRQPTALQPATGLRPSACCPGAPLPAS